MARFQILSLVGGGIRGAFITSFLNSLEERLGRPIAESFDLIAGTSTGGIIAAGLAAGRSAAELHDFYVRFGEKIFSPRPPYKAKGIWQLLFPLADRVFRWKTGGQLDAAFRARFCPFQLQEAFDEGFGELRLGEVDFTRLIIPSFNLSCGEPHVFRSLHLPKGFHDRDERVADVVIAATAAPTYFPHREIRGQAFIDGGVWATDPSLLAFAESMRIRQFEHGDAAFGRCDVHDVHLLSIGTGRTQFSLTPPGGDAGLLYWAPRIADVMGESQVTGVHLPLKFLLGDRYHHVNFKMEENWPLDGVQHIPELFEMGATRAEASYGWIEQEYFGHQRERFTPVTDASQEVKLDEFGFE